MSWIMILMSVPDIYFDETLTQSACREVYCDCATLMTSYRQRLGLPAFELRSHHSPKSKPTSRPRPSSSPLFPPRQPDGFQFTVMITQQIAGYRRCEQARDRSGAEQGSQILRCRSRRALRPMPRLAIAWRRLTSGRYACRGDIEMSHVPPDDHGRSE